MKHGVIYIGGNITFWESVSMALDDNSGLVAERLEFLQGLVSVDSTFVFWTVPAARPHTTAWQEGYSTNLQGLGKTRPRPTSAEADTLTTWPRVGM